MRKQHLMKNISVAEKYVLLSVLISFLFLLSGFTFKTAQLDSSKKVYKTQSASSSEEGKVVNIKPVPKPKEPEPPWVQIKPIAKQAEETEWVNPQPIKQAEETEWVNPKTIKQAEETEWVDITPIEKQPGKKSMGAATKVLLVALVIVILAVVLLSCKKFCKKCNTTSTPTPEKPEKKV